MWWPAGGWAIARRWLLIAVGVAVWRGPARLQQRVERGRRAWGLRRRLPREETRLLRWRPRFAGKPRSWRVILLRAFRIPILAVLVRHWPLSASIVTGRLATVAWLSRFGRHRRFTLCVHDAIGRNAPDGLVGAVLQQSVPRFTKLLRWILLNVRFATLRLCLRRSHVRLTTAVPAYTRSGDRPARLRYIEIRRRIAKPRRGHFHH